MMLTECDSGICACPEIVIGVSRAVLSDTTAPAKLRLLADLWDRMDVPPLTADRDWPLPGESPLVAEPHISRCRRQRR
jgi:hypothetical protein